MTTHHVTTSCHYTTSPLLIAMFTPCGWLLFQAVYFSISLLTDPPFLPTQQLIKLMTKQRREEGGWNSPPQTTGKALKIPPTPPLLKPMYDEIETSYIIINSLLGFPQLPTSDQQKACITPTPEYALLYTAPSNARTQSPSCKTTPKTTPTNTQCSWSMHVERELTSYPFALVRGVAGDTRSCSAGQSVVLLTLSPPVGKHNTFISPPRYNPPQVSNSPAP